MNDTPPPPATVDPALVEVVARAICDRLVPEECPYWHEHLRYAADVLTALAEHGALMPAGGERHEELGHGHNAAGYTIPCMGDLCAHAVKPDHRRTVTTYPEGHPLAGHTLTGPWQEADRG